MEGRMEGDIERTRSYHGHTVDIWSFPIFLSIIGVLFVAVMVFGQYNEYNIKNDYILTVLDISPRILAIISLLYIAIAIGMNTGKWISASSRSTVNKAMVTFLCIFGIVKTIFKGIYIALYFEFKEIIPKQVFNITLVLSISKIILTVIQMWFITKYHCFVLNKSRKTDGLVAIIAITNIVEWLISMSFFVNGNKDIVFNINTTMLHNDTRPWQSMSKVIKSLDPPVTLQYSILACTLILGMKDGGDYVQTTTNLYVGLKTRATIVWYTKKRAIAVAILASFQNAPFLVLAPLTIFYNKNNVVSKLLNFMFPFHEAITFLIILLLFYQIYINIKATISYKEVNLNEIALLIGLMALSAFSTLNLTFQQEWDFFYTLRWPTDIITTVYQTIFILIGRRITNCNSNDKDILQQSMLILICVNLTKWINNSLYGLEEIAEDVENKDFHILFYLLLPFITYFRFQSSMELIAIYNKMNKV